MALAFSPTPEAEENAPPATLLPAPLWISASDPGVKALASTLLVTRPVSEMFKLVVVTRLPLM